MDNLQWYDYLRLVTALITATACGISVTEARRNWERYNVRDRDYWWSFNALLLLMVATSIGAVVDNLNWNPRTLLAFIISLVCLRGMRRGLPPRPPFKPEDR